MKAGINGYRFAVFAGIGLLILLFSLMVTNLQSQLHDLAVAEDDNPQWSITQIDTEFANLSAALSQHLADGTLTDADIRLRVDIAISRLVVINSGRAATLFSQSETAQQMIDPINLFAERAIEISDRPGPLATADVRQLWALTEDIRPTVRKIALLGVELGAVRSEVNRAEFSRQLTRTGGIAITLLVLMAALMLLLDRLLFRAARRDAELLASSRLLTSTVAASLDAIVTANNKGQIIDYNASAETVFGWSREEIVGKTMEETIIPRSLREAHNAGMKRFLETGKPRVVDGGRVELSALRKSGEEFPIELNITSIKDDEGTKFVAYLRDISARKIDEQKLIDARDRAERTDKAKSQFLTVMSHEMRTPLNGILGVLDLLKTTKLTAKQSRYSDIATASSEILLDHINEALDITRIETGTFQLTPQDFELPALLATIVDVLRPLALEKGLKLELEIDAPMRRGFHGDSSRIRQILTNLAGNAIKFTDHGEIKIEVHGIHGPETSSLKIAVTDTGAGILPEHQEQVFEDFVALAHGEGRQSRGDGLGLSISRKIARQMGGDISVTSELGVGSTFTLTVPLNRQEEPVGCPVTDEEVPAQRALRICEILVVEDNDINRHVLRDMLLGMGHHVTEAVNGVDCLEKAQARRYDLIFMDISMPVMDGIEATQRLRAGSGPNKTTHIIGLTAHGREEFRDQAQDAGMSIFHTKPIRLAALQSIISEVSQGDQSAEAEGVGNDQLQELCAALGIEKVRSIGATFFDELDSFITDARAGELQSAPGDLARSAHRVKGAAALLGQHDLEVLLAEIENLVQDVEASEITERIEGLEKISGPARARYAQAVLGLPD